MLVMISPPSDNPRTVWIPGWPPVWLPVHHDGQWHQTWCSKGPVLPPQSAGGPAVEHGQDGRTGAEQAPQAPPPPPAPDDALWPLGRRAGHWRPGGEDPHAKFQGFPWHHDSPWLPEGIILRGWKHFDIDINKKCMEMQLFLGQ